MYIRLWQAGLMESQEVDDGNSKEISPNVGGRTRLLADAREDPHRLCARLTTTRTTMVYAGTYK
jgi:hypothetical protein